MLMYTPYIPLFRRFPPCLTCARDEFQQTVNPNSGAVIPGTGGCRKVRWSRSGQGKRGGTRVVYFNPTETTLWLLIVYTKSKFDNLPRSFLAQLRQEIENAL